MRLWLCVLAVAMGSVFLPATAHALCSCAMGAREEGTSERPWFGRQVVFTGYAIRVEHFLEKPQSIRRTSVLFVTEESWSGALPDTVSLFIDAGTCEQYDTGFLYLVAANWDKARPGRLVRRVCDYSWEGGARVDRLRKEVGPPNWVAASAWKRTLNARANPLGTRISREAGPGKVAFMPPTAMFVSRFEIGDFDGVGSPSGTVLYPNPGLYQVRVTWPDGVTAEGFALMQCSRGGADGDCIASNNFRGLRTAPRQR